DESSSPIQQIQNGNLPNGVPEDLNKTCAWLSVVCKPFETASRKGPQNAIARDQALENVRKSTKLLENRTVRWPLRVAKVVSTIGVVAFRSRTGKLQHWTTRYAVEIQTPKLDNVTLELAMSRVDDSFPSIPCALEINNDEIERAKSLKS